MRKLVLGLVGAAALSMGTTANADVIITPGTTVGIPAGFNDFTTDLNNLGLFYVTTTGATLTLTQGSVITFEVLGTESGYFDTFTAGPVSYTEMTGSLVNMFATPLAIGAGSWGAGSLAGILNFSSNYGVNATVGQDGFGIFLASNSASPVQTNVFYIGYDDQITGADDNHDDLIIRATVSPAVPEPATWAMMLLGFGAAGFALRRRRAPILAQAA